MSDRTVKSSPDRGVGLKLRPVANLIIVDGCGPGSCMMTKPYDCNDKCCDVLDDFDALDDSIDEIRDDSHR